MYVGTAVMSLSVGTGVPTHRALGVCQPLITVTKSAFFIEMRISIVTAIRLLYWDAQPRTDL